MWQNTVFPIVRAYIGDLDSTSYSDTRLTQICMAAAHSMLQEVTFDQSYTISIPNSSISPDPVDSSDFIFTNLLSLKTAVVITGSEARTKALQVLTIKDGPSTIETGGSASSTLSLADSLRKQYVQAKMDYIAGNSRSGGAVSTPGINQGIFPNFY